MGLYVSVSIRPDLESMISFIMLNEHSAIGPVKMLRQGRTKLLLVLTRTKLHFGFEYLIPQNI